MLPVLLTLLAVAHQEGEADLTTLSLEQLMQVEVTSVARKEQTLNDVAAAVFVVTREDILRSGATALPEVLRMVPGVHVARISASTWAVSVRGFNSRFSDDLLVMVDGRTVYSNLFSGVYWEALGVPLDLVERIEVVRGPGGTMWGANAVNGVINIITRSAEDSQGLELHGLGGDEELFATGVFGGELDDGHFRTHVYGGERDASRAVDGGEAKDAWRALGGGFRADWTHDERDAFLFTADAYGFRPESEFTLLDPTVPAPLTVSEEFEMPRANALGRWTRELEEGELSLQSFFNAAWIDSNQYEDERFTFDLDFQHRTPVGDGHELVWGLGYRVVDGDLEGIPALDMQDGQRTDHLFSAFVQDELTVSEDLVLTAGTKLEHNDLSGFEVQPSVRARYTLGERSSAWAAVSRAVRSPSVATHEILIPAAVIPGMPPVVTVITGDDDHDSEELVAYEVGYRTQPTERVSFDATAFYFDYDELTTLEPGTPFSAGSVDVQPLLIDNKGEGRSVGFELASDFHVREDWHLHGAVSILDLEIEAKDSLDPEAEAAEDNHPSWTASLRSQHALDDDLDLDLAFYAVDELEGLDVDDYVRVDARLAWRPRDGLELALGVRNLNESAHREFASEFASTATQVERAVYASLSWRP